MTRMNLGLFVVLIVTALMVVTSQHKARKLYSEYEALLAKAKKYNTAYEQLQTEQSTWAMHSRVEEVARHQLKMEVPSPKRIQVIILEELEQ